MEEIINALFEEYKENLGANATGFVVGALATAYYGYDLSKEVQKEYGSLGQFACLLAAVPASVVGGLIGAVLGGTINNKINQIKERLPDAFYNMIDTTLGKMIRIHYL